MKFRTKILACFIALSLVALTLPVRLDFNTLDKRVELKANEAEAVVPVAGAAAAFLAEIAAASGLTVGEFVATIAGITAVGTGMGIAIDEGINYGNDASVNLGNLIDAADYPAWDSLTSEQQEAWGSKEYYDSAKFNSLLDAFDLGDARERFYSSSGGNIDYTSSETSRLEQLGRIGQNWINNGSNTVNDILSSFSVGGQQYLKDSFTLNTAVIHGSDYAGWPENAPSTVVLTYASKIYTQRQTSNTNMQYAVIQTDKPVYMLPYTFSYTTGGDQYYGSLVFDANEFNYNYATVNYSPVNGVFPEPNLSTINTQPTQQTYNDKIYYEATASMGKKFNNTIANFESNGYLTSAQITALRNAIPLILFGENLNIGSAPVDIVGYPEDISQDGDLNVYFPATGIVPGSDWQDYETQPDTPPIIDEEVDLTEIIELLKRFHFTVDYNLLVQDNPLRSAVMEIASSVNRFNFYTQYGELKVHDQRLQDAMSLLLGNFQFYSTGELKVHDAGVYSAISDMSNYLGGLLTQIQATLSGFFVTDTAGDIIGDLDFPELGDKAADLVDTISTLAPFGAVALLSELVAILSQTGKIAKPEMTFDFDFMPDQQYEVQIDLSWLDDVRPVINVFCIITLVIGLYGCTARLIELEAAA